MMKPIYFKLLLLICLLSISHIAKAQDRSYIEGVVLDIETGTPLSRVRVYNATIHQEVWGTNSGQFKIAVRGDEDNISFHLLGYKTLQLRLEPGKRHYTTYLEKDRKSVV